MSGIQGYSNIGTTSWDLYHGLKVFLTRDLCLELWDNLTQSTTVTSNPYHIIRVKLESINGFWVNLTQDESIPTGLRVNNLGRTVTWNQYLDSGLIFVYIV